METAFCHHKVPIRFLFFLKIIQCVRFQTPFEVSLVVVVAAFCGVVFRCSLIVVDNITRDFVLFWLEENLPVTSALIGSMGLKVIKKTRVLPLRSHSCVQTSI